jgi:ATP-dependent Clp protease protease subunit
MIHQGSSGYEGTPTDIEIHAKEVLSLRRRVAEILAAHSHQTVEQVEQDIDRDRFMSAEEAKGYGVIDEVITARDRLTLRPFSASGRDDHEQHTNGKVGLPAE